MLVDSALAILLIRLFHTAIILLLKKCLHKFNAYYIWVNCIYIVLKSVKNIRQIELYCRISGILTRYYIKHLYGKRISCYKQAKTRYVKIQIGLQRFESW